MVTINGRSANSRNGICQVCGAKLRTEGDPKTCPNIERNDHQGKPYAAGARLAAGDK